LRGGIRQKSGVTGVKGVAGCGALGLLKALSIENERGNQSWNSGVQDSE
jgi:hypothetical protein